MNSSALSSSLWENSIVTHGWDTSRIKVTNTELYTCTGGRIKKGDLLLHSSPWVTNNVESFDPAGGELSDHTPSLFDVNMAKTRGANIITNAISLLNRFQWTARCLYGYSCVSKPH